MTLKAPTGINKEQFTFKALRKTKFRYSSLNHQDLSFPNYPEPSVFLSVHAFPFLCINQMMCTLQKQKQKLKQTNKQNHVM